MNKIRVLLACVFLSLFVNLYAQDNKLSEVLNEMEKADKEVSSLEVSYTQEILFLTTNEKQIINGNLKYQKPNLIYIVQKTPQEQRMYIDGKTITIYTPENMQAIIDNWKTVINGDFSPASIVNFGSNWRDVNKDNEIKFISEDNNDFKLEIYPKNNADWKMNMFVSKKTYRPNKAVFLSDGVKVTVIMEKYKINPEINKNIFKFKAPNGVDVINLN